MAEINLQKLHTCSVNAIAVREWMVVIGPPGCGKTTSVRMVAGLEDLSENDFVTCFNLGAIKG